MLLFVINLKTVGGATRLFASDPSKVVDVNCNSSSGGAMPCETVVEKRRR